jgi:hypothetical protein
MKAHYVVALVSMMVGPAFAGLFSASISSQDVREIKRLAVVSTLGDTVHGRSVGLTVFQNKSFDAPVPGWNLDAALARAIAQGIVAGGRIGGDVLSIATQSTKDSDIVREAGAQGFDAVLIVLPEENVHDRSLGSGVTLLHRKLPGVDKVHPCIVGTVRVFRASDGKQIGASVIEPCSYARNTLVWHDTWDAFSDEEKQAALAALQEQSLERIRKALVDLKLCDH